MSKWGYQVALGVLSLYLKQMNKNFLTAGDDAPQLHPRMIRDTQW